MTKVYLMFTILICQISFAQDYAVVSISGFLETKKKTNSDEYIYSAIHHDYPAELNSLVKERYRFNHGVSKKKLLKLIKKIGCRKDSNTGLIIVTNSWGSRKANILADIYQEKCGESTELFVQIDGIKKPIGPQDKMPKAVKCINYYQKETFILHGGPIKGCENRVITPECNIENKRSFENCHVYICRKAAEYAQRDISDYIKFKSTSWFKLERNPSDVIACPVKL